MKARAEKATGPQGGPVEIWGQLEQNNRFLRRLCGVAVAWAFLALAAGIYGVGLALYRPLAFFVDSEGRASFSGRLRERAAPSEVEVKHVAKDFLEKYVALNSLTVESDQAQAWQLMTAELRKEHQGILARYEKEHGEEFVAFIKRQGIQAVLEWDGKRTEYREHNAKFFTVKLGGIVRTWPVGHAGEDAPTSEKEFESILTLVRCPRTEQTPNGLLVHKISTRFFAADSKEERR